MAVSCSIMITIEEMNTGNTRTLLQFHRVEARNWIGGWLEYVGDRARSISKGNQSREGSLFFTEQHQCRLLPR